MRDHDEARLMPGERDRGAVPDHEFAETEIDTGIVVADPSRVAGELGEHRRAIRNLEHQASTLHGLVATTNDRISEVHEVVIGLRGDIKGLTDTVGRHIEQSNASRNTLAAQVEIIRLAKAADDGAAAEREKQRKEAREESVPLIVWGKRLLLTFAALGVLATGLAWASGRMSAPSERYLAKQPPGTP